MTYANTTNCNVTENAQVGITSGSSSATEKRYHRICEVRREQGVSLRSAARQLKLDMATVRHQENASTDLSLNQLQAWQRCLDVPLSDLLVDPGASLSSPVMERARLVRLMKTAASISEQAESDGIQRLATMLTQQLTEIMPELAEISAWHSVGQRRSLDEYGRVVERRLRDDFFISRHDD